MLIWFEVLGYTVLSERENSSTILTERENQVILRERLEQSLKKINPHVSELALQKAIQKLQFYDGKNNNNATLQDYLTQGVDVSYYFNDKFVFEKVQIVDYTHPLNNDWLAVHQFSLTVDHWHYSPEIVIFINGLPLVIIEVCKILENRAIESFYNNIFIYKEKTKKLFDYAQILVISQGNEVRFGHVNQSLQEFKVWSEVEIQQGFSDWKNTIAGFIQDYFDKRYFLHILKAKIQAKPVDRQALNQLIENEQSSDRFSEQYPIKQLNFLKKRQRKKRIITAMKLNNLLKPTQSKKF
ncbi:type I restriction endonuclease [Capilliphycus salinus ALCB114379]|uniref:type I restriction endonuclease n=1 Tax=Capilliphycus salinus TaxID=2768948 RepID=UPI0039A55E9B